MAVTPQDQSRLQAKLDADPQYQRLLRKYQQTQAAPDWATLTDYALNRTLNDEKPYGGRYALGINGQGQVEVDDINNPFTSPAFLGPLAVGAAAALPLLGSLFGSGGAAGGAAGTGGTLASHATVPLAGSLPSGLASGTGAAALGVGDLIGPGAGLAAAGGGATGGALSGAGAGGVTAAGSARNWLGPLVTAAAPVVARGISGGSGTGGGTNGGSNVPPELMELLQEAIRRQQEQRPLFSAVSRQALAGLPSYVKGGP